MDGMQPDGGPSAQARGFFPGFAFKGDQDLKALASFYGLALPAIEPVTLGEYLQQTYQGIPQPGYRVAVGYAELCVLEVEEGLVTKVGLRPLPFRDKAHSPQSRALSGRRHTYPPPRYTGPTNPARSLESGNVPCRRVLLQGCLFKFGPAPARTFSASHNSRHDVYRRLSERAERHDGRALLRHAR
jgi:hypothetical protein